jgi:hypothetical protein
MGDAFSANTKPQAQSKTWNLFLLPPVQFHNSTPYTLFVRMTNRADTHEAFVGISPGSKQCFYKHTLRDKGLVLEVCLHEDWPNLALPVARNTTRYRQIWLPVCEANAADAGLNVPVAYDYQQMTCDTSIDNSCGHVGIMFYSPICLQNKTGIPLSVAFEKASLENYSYQQQAPAKFVRSASSRMHDSTDPLFSGVPGVAPRHEINDRRCITSCEIRADQH